MSKVEYEVDGAVFATHDDQLDGRQLRDSGGLSPASDYVLVRIDEGFARSVGLEETEKLPRDRKAVFRSFENDHVNTFTVNERGWEWGADEIAETEVRRIGHIPEDYELFLDSDQDAVIAHGAGIQLAGHGVERIRSRKKKPPLVTILVNARPREVEPGLISFERLIALAFAEPPTGPQVSFTVSYRKGPADRPEGSLIPGQSVTVVQGMIFNVTATDKS